MEVSHADMLTLHSPHTALQTEAGCWIMINAMLLHVATNLDSAGCYCYCASVATRLEPTGYIYRGVIDYMIILLTDLREVRLIQLLRPSNLIYFLDLIAQPPKSAFPSEAVRKLLSCNIYEAKAMSDAVMPALPQPAMATAVKGKQLEYSNFISSNMVNYRYYRLDTFYTTILMSEV